jgi:membrane associated rhomboid family serine protease
MRLKLPYLNAKINTATLGASGAVFGILLAFGMLFPNALIYIYFFFPMKAKYLVILYGLFELYSGVANNPDDNVAHFAHLGGMLIGFILLKAWNIKRSDSLF